MLKLRPYQREAVEAVYRHLREHDDNPVVVLPTGSGKTPVMATICHDAVTLWSGRVLVLAQVKELLEQTAGTLNRLDPDLHVGVYSAGLKRRDTGHPVIVAGIRPRDQAHAGWQAAANHWRPGLQRPRARVHPS
jgi:DNA repair protein RadD